MRQSARPNDHPTTPTFLHLYKILSVYLVLKPPKQGNCTVTEVDVPKVSLADLREIFENKTSERFQKIVEDNEWEACDVLSDMDSKSESSIRDCLVYYVCGYVTRKILKHKKCEKCIAFLKSGDVTHQSGELVEAKSRGQLIHPNKYLFEF